MKDHSKDSKKNQIIPSFTIMPDFGGAYIWDNRKGNYRDPEFSAMVEIAGRISAKFPKKLLQDFEKWYRYFELNAWEDSKLRAFDWRWFHQEGIELAVQLKQVCGDSAHVIYEKPFEDPNRKLNERREVLGDGQLIEA